MTGVDELLTWLRQQLDEDERVARATLADNVRGHWRTVPASTEIGLHEAVVDEYAGVRLATGSTRRNEHIARWDPARVLAEVETKRARLLWIESELADDPTNETAQWLAKLEAEPYAGQPGWREEWRSDV